MVRFTDPARGTYRKLVIRDGRLVGAILLGDTDAVGTLTQLFDRGGPLPGDRARAAVPRAGRRRTVGRQPGAACPTRRRCASATT